MIYGYSSRVITREGLLEMKEITIEAPPSVLREIACFLAEMADAVDNGECQTEYHKHISSVIPGWSKRFPTKDIIVMCPNVG